ncbi:RidA family protein [Phytomonospora endophytica]|uniref:Enamine deaminase RidA (YjgF/YER057c/UK114 family) n=1 Tax=Phytomonospora endophytica TaxID=714109 RepID=A0A841FQU5_9ACTN|nr:RidA family protein [Phytomonospora endophytica]MBB6034929.1 enamine deaminase RidA (YjgF/YER057c/UK114 family) [Phytomonospora endophytica]GIG70633.1 enamine deaminase RidA [Phytomonospora endophytica]
MTVTYLDPDTVPAPAAAYTHTARVDLGTTAMIFVSGQVALDDDGEVVGEGDMTAQTEHVFAGLEKLLAAHGGTLADIVNIRTFITDMDLRPEHGAVRIKWLAGREHPPTSTLVEVPRLFRPGLLVEVEVVAVVAA